MYILVMIKSEIKCYTLEVVEINLSIVSWDKTLNLRCGKHMQPLWVNDAAEAPDESCSLLFYLCVHPKVSHEVDVADSAGDRRGDELREQQPVEGPQVFFNRIRINILVFIGDWHSFAPRYQLMTDKL